MNGVDNFCALTHRLNPEAYNLYQQRLRDKKSPKYSISQLMRCSNCNTLFTTETSMQIHIFGNTITCRCGTPTNYENLAVRTYFNLYKSHPNSLIPDSYRVGNSFPNSLEFNTWNEVWRDIEARKDVSYEYQVFWYKSFQRIMGVLSSSGIDLILGMYRQLDFIIKICESPESCLYWKSPEIINQSIRRYHKFLVLFDSEKKLMVVPTVDIDLVWHSHLSESTKYRTFFRTHASKFLNHDDTITHKEGEDGFEKTYFAWLEKYDEQYSYHCPVSKNKKADRKLCTKAKILRAMKEKTSHFHRIGTPVNLSLSARKVSQSRGRELFPANFYEVRPFIHNNAPRTLKIPVQPPRHLRRSNRRVYSFDSGPTGGGGTGGCGGGGDWGGGDGGGGDGDGGGGCGGGDGGG